MTFPADSSLVADIVPSPNHEPRRAAIDILLLHYTGMASTDAALERLTSIDAKVSSHYLVRENGRVVQLVAETYRAFHAGLSAWEGTTDINSRSIGIEIANAGHDFGCPPFPEAQVAAVIALARDIVARRAVRADRVLAHSDVSPGRKRDPGELFPWPRLAAAGVGLRVAPRPVVTGAALRQGDAGDEVRALQSALARFGYGIAVTGTFDETTHDVVAAFQRHFRPAQVDGIADRSTVATLDDVLTARMTA